MPLTVAERAVVNFQLGINPVPGGGGYPALNAKLLTIYKDKIQKLPWVPPSWYAGVAALAEKYPGDFMMVSPGLDLKGDRGSMAPAFADDAEKLAVWQQIFSNVKEAFTAYAQKRVDEGAAKMAAFAADAAFWNAAYLVVKTVADLPGAIATKTGGWLGDFVLGDLKKNWGRNIALILLVVVGLLYLWKPDAVQRAFGGAIAGIKRLFKVKS